MPTIRDVARESGVSIATVSYVLNDGPRPVRAETRRQVLATMQRLGYHPNANARALVHGRVNTLGLLFGDVEPAFVTNDYASGVVQGVLTAAADRGYNVTFFTQPWKDAASSAAPFTDGRCDGVLVIAPLADSDMVEGLARLDLPLVVVSAVPEPESGIGFVDVDNQKGARLAADHLIGLGHTRIAHVTGQESQSSVAERRAGFRAAMAAAGLEVRSSYVVISKYGTRKTGYPVARGLLTLPEPPTAIFAGNDTLALAVMDAARDLGISVPEQLSIVGFDDVPSASLVSPPLTTVRQPLAEIGERATRLLVARIQGEAVTPATYRLEPELVVRGSTAPPPLSS